MKKILCLACERNCMIRVERDVVAYQLTGHQCKWGRDFAMNELAHPMRMLTATVKTGGVPFALPVKSSGPLPRERLKEAMRALSLCTVTRPVRAGERVVTNLLGLSVDMIATADYTPET